MKRIMALIVIPIAVYSGYVTFEWIAEKEKIDVIEDYATSLSDLPLLEIADAGSVLEYLIENNASDEILREKLHQYFTNTRTLEYSSLILYEATGDKKYWSFRTAMANLKGFFMSVRNRPDPKTVLKENLDIIKDIEKELSVKRITDFTEKEVERIFDLSAKLEY